MVLSACVYLCVHGFCCSLCAFLGPFLVLFSKRLFRADTVAVGFQHAGMQQHI